MPTATFYLIDKPRFREEPLLLVCELARRCLEKARQPTLVLARSAEQAEALDELLWEFDPDAFIPHQVAGSDEDDDDTPVLIVAPGTDAPGRPLIINLRDEAVTLPCERVLEVVAAEESERAGSRQRWSIYKRRGFELAKHDM